MNKEDSKKKGKGLFNLLDSNNYKGQVKAEQGAKVMAEIELSYVPDSSGQHYPLAGSETNYGNMGQAYAAISQTQYYTPYLNNMSRFNYDSPLSNEGSAESLAAYQIRVKELTNSLNQTEEMLSMAQAMNESMHNVVNGLRSENESLNSHYSMKVSALEREKLAFRRDLDWVMKIAIPRILARVFRSKQFDCQMVKVQNVFVERGRKLGHQEARDLLMAN
nr:hypothetical protein [Tanacetum cinerariifolium]